MPVQLSPRFPLILIFDTLSVSVAASGFPRLNAPTVGLQVFVLGIISANYNPVRFEFASLQTPRLHFRR